MEAKKSPKVDLERRRGLYLEIGLIVALVLTAGAFAYRTIDRGIDKIDMGTAPVEQDLTEITREPESQPEPPQKVEIKVMSDVLVEVENDSKVATDMNWDEFDANTEIVVTQPKREEIVEEEIFVVAEVMPKFMGGDLNTFRNWVQERVKYPADAQEMGISGQVILSFVVEPSGVLSNIEVLKTPDRSLSEEAIRVLKTSPKWTPAKQRGRSVRLKYTLPVTFRIS